MFIAIIHGEFDIVKYFAKQRHYLECTDNDGLTPLLIGIPFRTQFFSFCLAAYYHKWNIVKHLADNSADLECTDMYGRQLIHKGEQFF